MIVALRLRTSQSPITKTRGIASLTLPLLFASLFLPFCSLFVSTPVEAQVEPPDRRYLYIEDAEKKKFEKRKRAELKQKRKSAKPNKVAGATLPFDINATSIDFDSSGNKVKADGDVIITYSSLVAEAESGEVDIANNEAELRGDVRISDVGSNLTADAASINLEDGSGKMSNTEIYFAEGDYQLFAAEADRKEGDVYSLKDSILSTCQCPKDEDCLPWSLRAKEAEITRDGYGYAWNTSFTVQDVPVFYFPFLVFPAKNERQSGFLFPTIGTGRQSGLNLDIPFYWAIGESTDATITGVYESEIRYGTDLEFRKVFARNHSLEMGGIYLNESARDGRLFGTNIDDLDDPTLDTNRFAGYVDHSWTGDLGPLPLQFLLDGNFVSDDLFLREYDKPEIDERNARFVTSTAVLRAPITTTYGLEVRGEYNQAIVTDDDFVFQRLPEASIVGIDTFRPFGENPLGLKLVTSSELSYVNFTRRESFEGSRLELQEKVKLPFYVGNYLDGAVTLGVTGSQYDLSDNESVTRSINEDGEEVDEVVEILDDSTNRVVPSVTGELGTVLEKVIAVPEDSLFKKFAELGTIGRRSKLVRLKHTIEPGVKYKFVPFVSQSENPQFDSGDRLAQRNVVTYELTQRLYGRYEPRDPYLYGIEEAAPELDDVPGLRSQTPLDQQLSFGFEPERDGEEFQRLRQGAIRELAEFTLSQSFDVLEERKDRDPDENSFSDLGADLELYPNEYIRLKAATDFDFDQSQFSAYTLQGQFTSKRGDSLRTRLRFVRPSIRQLESSLEIKITDRVKLGYYSRFDDLTGSFIEQKGGIRVSSNCNCWLFDIDVTDKVNPDETQFTFNVTLVGLGEIGNTFFQSLSEEESNS